MTILLLSFFNMANTLLYTTYMYIFHFICPQTLQKKKKKILGEYMYVTFLAPPSYGCSESNSDEFIKLPSWQ